MLTSEQCAEIENALRWLQPHMMAYRILTDMLSRESAAPDEGRDSDVGHALIERLRKTMTRLGVFPGEGMEWFAANLESNLYSLDSAVNAMLDAIATAPTMSEAARVRELELQVESLTKQRNEAHNIAHANAVLKDRAIALLRRMEWANNRWSDCCPECEGQRGHAKDCELGAFIAEIERIDRAAAKGDGDAD